MADTAGLDIRVQLDFAGLKTALEQLGHAAFPNTAQAVEDSLLLAQRLWISFANGAPVSFKGGTFSIRRVSGAYARSIQDGLQYPFGGNPLLGSLSADTPYARAIESGSGPHDLKEALLNGPKARTSKAGHRYNIVPFEHGTPGTVTKGRPMPAELYAQAKELPHSVVTGRRPGTNARGEEVSRSVYRWGGRLGRTDIGWRSRIGPPGQEYTHTTSIYSGMVRMGNAKHSSFLTFRVVSDLSPSNSWQSPGTPPKPASEAVAETIRPQAVALIRKGFAQDLALIGGE